jgi:L-histidine N-alpha-methyltransferase
MNHNNLRDHMSNIGVYTSQLDNEFAHDVKEGLNRTNNKKVLKPKYFYDKTGSQLFEQICDQPEYYLTPTELAILRDHSSHIAKMYYDGNDSQISIIELGSGSSTKTRILLKSFIRGNKQKQQPYYYFPIDVSYTILYETVHKFTSDFPYLCTVGICSGYIEGVKKVTDFIVSSNDHIPHRKLMLFLGSSIGNFEPKESRTFLKTIRRIMETCGF